jgi:hypothetical protein
MSAESLSLYSFAQQSNCRGTYAFVTYATVFLKLAAVEKISARQGSVRPSVIWSHYLSVSLSLELSSSREADAG